MYLTISNEFIDEIVVVLQSLQIDGSSAIWEEIKAFNKGTQSSPKK